VKSRKPSWAWAAQRLLYVGLFPDRLMMTVICRLAATANHKPCSNCLCSGDEEVIPLAAYRALAALPNNSVSSDLGWMSV
jgi:hypothetical protein